MTWFDSSERIANYYDGLVDMLSIRNRRHDIVLKQIEQALKIQGGTRHVLDLCRGTGITTRAIADMGFHALGVDIAPALIERAQAETVNGNAKFMCADVSTIDLGKSFDAIMLVDCLEHLGAVKRERIVDVIARHTHENSIVYANVPDERFLSMMKARHPEKLQIIDDPLSIETLASMFRRAGFEIISCEFSGYDAPLQYVSMVMIHKAALAAMFGMV